MRWSLRSARAIRSLSHRYYKLKANWLGLDKLRLLGPQRAAAGRRRPAASPGPRRAGIVLDAYRAFSPELAVIGERFFDQALDRCAACGRARRPAPSRTRPCPRRIPICC